MNDKKPIAIPEGHKLVSHAEMKRMFGRPEPSRGSNNPMGRPPAKKPPAPSKRSGRRHQSR